MIILSHKITGKLDDQLVVVITKYVFKINLSRSIKRLKVVHALNVVLNLLVLETFHALTKMRITRGDHIVQLSSWALSACLLSLVFDNAVVSCRQILLGTTLRWLIKIRLIMHAVLLVVAIG